MSVSAIFGVKITPTPSPAVRTPPTTTISSPPSIHYNNNNSLFGSSSSGGLMIECSSRPQKKATAHHRKTRPKKTQPWDRNRGPAVYPPLPALPPEWSFVTNEEEVVAVEAGVSADSATVSEIRYRFELIPDSAAVGVVLAESTLSTSKDGGFVIDLGVGNGVGRSGTKFNVASLVCSLRGSGNYGSGLWTY